MAAYIVATVQILDPAKFAEYGAAIKGMSARFGGESVIAGPVAEILEGEGVPGERVVVTRFPDGDSARAYIGSPDYVAASARRDGAATVVMRLIEA